MNIPCGPLNMPSPHALRKRPSLSNTIMGWAPRLNTYTLSWESHATPATSMYDQPSGIWSQPSRTSYSILCGPIPTRYLQLVHLNLQDRYSGFAPHSRTTCVHFGISFLRYAANSDEVPPCGSAPCAD